ncbi:iron-sulfur cluster repair di-iron protein [Mangrovivirga sp. M17]|uniref:Iron-sulfur cluster repair di-iron protein n=1 Tax=Mangrovivirga halotolerans TaxID=2993936 RepID=A0ABT3RSG2_9BACT|nr:iron-sulfur cluster repair di-iron protein [Mangrovivirga halotolerans]MCX2744570.1 iron-sulfur cluster repair di-iron protein [Mangrovivirga halotolerans]
MDYKVYKHKTLNELVGANHIFASILNDFGIRFYEYPELTLEEVCKNRGLLLEKVVSKLEKYKDDNSIESLKLFTLPVDLIIEYLKHAHHIFIKRRLPYISSLLRGAEKVKPEHEQIIQDLKFVYPIFVEDFIHHIYQEEDTLFTYITKLQKAVSGDFPAAKLFFELEKHSVRKYAVDHEIHEDELEGLKKITNNFDLKDQSDIHMNVIMKELQSFEQELKIHASIEDEILFPKALMLEKEVKKMLSDNKGSN